MKRMILFLVVVSTLIVFGDMRSGSPQLAYAASGCEEADLRGTYAFSLRVVSGLPSSPEQDAFAGFWIFDGLGGVTGRGAGMENGIPTVPGTFTGTYGIESDCGGTLNLAIGGDPSEILFFASNRLERLHFLLVDPGTAAVGIADKQ